MKVRSSLKSLKGRHRDCKIVRRKGVVYVINKTDPRFKAKQGEEPRRRLQRRRGYDIQRLRASPAAFFVSGVGPRNWTRFVPEAHWGDSLLALPPPGLLESGVTVARRPIQVSELSSWPTTPPPLTPPRTS